MADPGHHHSDLKTEVTKIHKEAEHEHNVKEKHHEIHHPKPAANPYPELEHQVETGKIEVVSADGKVTGEARETITNHPPQH